MHAASTAFGKFVIYGENGIFFCFAPLKEQVDYPTFY